MQSGRETLASIDDALRQVRRQGQELDDQIQRASSDLLRLRKLETEKFRALANIRLSELMTGEVISGLDDVDRRVGDLLQTRESELDELQRQIDRCRRGQEELETARRAQEQSVAEAAQRLDRAEAETQRRLAQNPAHGVQLERARAADAVAKEAEAKTEQAQKDRVDKGKPYESDPLFMYLWKRSYGTSRYSAFPILRFFDAKVAKLCDYHEARPNYAMLLDIPLRLREHAELVRAAADEEFESLREIEERAAQADGLPAVREAMEEAQAELDEIDGGIREAEEQGRQLVAQRADYAAGEDEAYGRAIEMLQAEFQRDSIVSLRHQARATPSAEDDLLIQELADIEDERERLEEDVAHNRRLYERHLARLRELEQVRTDFKQHRYDDVHSTFSNGDLLVGILNEFLRGVASSGDLWGTLRRHHRRRPTESDPGFGTGGFGRAGPVWRVPFPRRRGRLGGRGGGGFRTGGGF